MTTSAENAAGFTLNHIAIMVPQMDPGIAWYQDKLGVTIIDRWADAEKGMEWALLQMGDFVLELVQMPGFDKSPGRLYGMHHIAINVEDCDATVDRLRAAGAEIFREPTDFDRHGLRWAFVRDYLGNTLEFMSPLKTAGA